MSTSHSHTASATFSFTAESLHYVVTHIFSPDTLDKKNVNLRHECSLVRAVHAATQAYAALVDETSALQWLRVTRMLDNLKQSSSSSWLDDEAIVYQLRAMQHGDVLAFHAQLHNHAFVLTKREAVTLFESFKVPPEIFIGPYPSSAAEMANAAFEDMNFQVKFANLLCSGYSHHNFLCGISHAIDAPPIIKHLDHTHERFRSSLWLLTRIAIQTSLSRPDGRDSYKAFMLFFMCALASDVNVATLPSDLILSISYKILRRWSKLRSLSIPGWLSQMALKACASLRELVVSRRAEHEHLSSSFRNPSQVDLERDTRLSLKNSHEYILNAFTNHHYQPMSATFHPSHHPRGTLEDFLSSNGEFFEETYRADPFLTLCDVEKAVEEGIDDWIAHVVDIDKACAQLEILMDKYTEGGRILYRKDRFTIPWLTVIELFVAIDKLVLKEIPMLADYSPETPVVALERLGLHKRTSLHRVSCTYQYLSSRQSRSQFGWSVLSDESSLPVRYYDQSPALQRLKTQIEEEVIVNATQSPLPASSLDTKIVVFELQCPPLIRIWRSAAARIGYYLYRFGSLAEIEDKSKLLQSASTLKPHFVGDARPLSVQIHFAYLYHVESPSSPTLRYAIQRPDMVTLVVWQSPNLCEDRYDTRYTYSTSHTPNDVLANQANCDKDLSLDEFIAIGQLRSGGSLQWLNILHGLRCRTLNIRHPDVHKLLRIAVCQVGPLDLNTGKWIWHQELEDASFVNALLKELEDLFVDIGTCIIDAEAMSSISQLLTRILAASPSQAVSEQGIALLRRVRRKTFDWVRELSYNLGKDPTIEERRTLLLSMSAACETTFDVDTASLPKHFQSPEDLGAALVHTLFTRGLSYYHHPARLSIVLGNFLSDVVLADVSDHAIDLVVRMFFPRHKPGVLRWEHCPDTSWFTCRIMATTNQPSRVVHLNLFDGDFRVEGERVGNLERAIWDHHRSDDLKFLMSTFPASCFRSGLFVLQDAESTTVPTMYRCKIHIPLRGREWTIRMWRNNDSKDILEWVPSRILQYDLPSALVVGHIHWLNLTEKRIEICALQRPFEQATENWRIDCRSGWFCAYKGRETLVDVGSPTWRMMSECFRCLNVFVFMQEENDFVRKPIDLLVTTIPIQLGASSVLQLSVTLPCHGLSFFVNEDGELESHDIKHMVVDEKPQIETLFGIDFLPLRQKSTLPKGLFFRQIIVPKGAPKMHDHLRRLVRFELVDHEKRNVAISPKKPSSRRSEPKASIHIYDVDTELGCLTGSGSVASTQLLADMHAATSWVIPDPLTRKTGAQASSLLLQSGAYQSLETVDDKIWNIREQFRRSDDIPAFSDRSWEKFTLHGLLGSRPIPELPPRSVLQADGFKRNSDDIHLLNRLFPSLEMTQTYSTLQLDYIAQLRVSALHARKEFNETPTLSEEDRIDILKRHFVQCRATYQDTLASLQQALGPTSDPYEQGVYQFGGWPPIVGDTLLRCLASTSTTSLPEKWRKGLTSFALILLDVQRSRRLLRFALDGLEEEFLKELENGVCDGWNPEEYPDWLLIQIQGNFLIRRDQVDIAKEIMSPKSGKNTVMQVNMGEGKSSVIIPIAAAALADGKQLARIIVPKALTTQMFEILVMRLGGLTNRPIYHIPFSRPPYLNNNYNDIDVLQDMMSQFLVVRRGILLMQPQHVASLKLTCIEQQMRKDISVAKSLSKVLALPYEYFEMLFSFQLFSKNSFVGNMFRQLSQVANHSSPNVIIRQYDRNNRSVLNTPKNASKLLHFQKWMDSRVRDILDESDEILHPRFQLLYTVGAERHIDGYPERWTITLEVLQLLKECTHMLAKSYPNSVEIETITPGSFPHVGISQGSEIGLRVMRMIVELVMAGRIPNFNFQDLSPDLHEAIRSFISDKDVLQNPDTVKKVEEYAKCSDQSCMWGGLLLLRGLLVSHIPLFAIVERRWRVNYGLIPRALPVLPPFHRSTTLAVPYRSKDVPALNTQFAHPDMTIILTCLSYYYSGLNELELRSSFEILFNQDDPHAEYARWIKDVDMSLLPHSLRKLSEINLRSSDQWDKDIFPLFTRNQGAVNFYLSRVVFPDEMKEFPWKISASSWDLAEKRTKLITGFSGTNDCRLLLPLSIAQRDLDHQLGTNAKVLACLLRPENDFYTTTHATGKRLTTHELIRTVASQQPEIRVLLDVGAQILDCSNDEVALTWLNIVRDAAGAVCFNEQDELMVFLRNGTSMPFPSSALSRHLGRCLVYLDHVHTRGTDLKLPVGSRAAVTLGPKVTKDCLVQGCMRMRKLGRGHSIMFFAPPEVDLSIRGLKKDVDSRITSVDILAWSIHETWSDIQQWAPYWAKQGLDHKARQEAWTRFCDDGLTKAKLSDVWLQRAVQSLEDLYAPRETKPFSSTLLELDPAIHQRCKNLGVVSLPGAPMDEEQERDPPGTRARTGDVVTFVETGITPALYSSDAFRPIFTTLAKASAAPREAGLWCPFILATEDFCITIKPTSTRGTIDQYLRPVQWILSSERDPNVLVLISPFEANCLLPSIRESEHVHLHLYSARTSQRMKPSDDLKLYVIPPLPSSWTPPWALIDQLNVFAGQLYLRDYLSNLRLCRLLGLPTEQSPNAVAARWNVFDLFDNPKGRESMFSRSPLPFVMALLAIRTRGRPFGHTHMGKILYGQLLTERDFEDP